MTGERPHIDGIADTGDGYSLTKDGRLWDVRCIWCDWASLGNRTKTDAQEFYDEHEAEVVAAELGLPQ